VIAVPAWDTIVVRLGSEIRRVRYLGLKPPGEATAANWNKEMAREANEQLVGGRMVRLEARGAGPGLDAQGRLLRHVWMGERLVNAELVWWGYACSAGPTEGDKYRPVLVMFESKAREAQRGMWSPSAPHRIVIPTPAPTEAPMASAIRATGQGSARNTP
jgi:endonuclease YncB( thermonuclease family)